MRRYRRMVVLESSQGFSVRRPSISRGTEGWMPAVEKAFTGGESGLALYLTRTPIVPPKPLVLALSAVALCGVVYAGLRPVGPLPPLGRLLDPVRGVWGAAGNALLLRNATVGIPGLQGAVEVRYDDRGVPHIFATTEEDAYRALG